MQLPSSLSNPEVGASIEFKGSHRNVAFDGGRRFTKQVRSRPTLYSVRWHLSDAQRLALEAFHREAGVTPFLMMLPSPEGWKAQQVRFADQLSFSYRGVDAWDCSSALLMMLPTYLTKNELESELVYMLGDWQDLGFSTKLDTLVNITLPAIFG